MSKNRIFLSPPHMSGKEQTYINEAFATNWIAPIGPNLNAFEENFCEYVQSPHALGTSSGTAAIHLALLHLNIKPGDEVFVSTLTFSASVNPIIYCGATPVFIDSEAASWNIDPELVEKAIQERLNQGKALPKAIIVVHLYGQMANMDPLCQLCDKYNIPLIEDAAEALGATYKGRHAGTFGICGISSFNGNKIITTSSGGMLFSADQELITHSRKLATQAREAEPYYQHKEIGYNYRLSNILAGVGIGQLNVIEDRVQKRRANFDYYVAQLQNIPGLSFMPEAPWGRANRWLSVILLDPKQISVTPEELRLHLETHNIESRPVWKPMHLQPVYHQYAIYGGKVSEMLFATGLCLPSGSSLSTADLKRIVTHIKEKLT